MEREKQKRFSPPAVGGISLLAAFAVLCLTVFALLCLSTVRADIRLADAAARSVEVYSYSCPLSDTRALKVSVRLEGSDYTVLRWQAVATGEWESDNTLEVWDGTEF